MSLDVLKNAMKVPVRRTVVRMTGEECKRNLVGFYEEPGVIGGIASVMCEGLELYLFPIDEGYGVLWAQAGPSTSVRTVVVFSHEWETLSYKAAMDEMLNLALGSTFSMFDSHRILDDGDDVDREQEDREQDEALEMLLATKSLVEGV